MSKLITTNDLKAILDEIFPWKKTETLTPTITVTTGTLVGATCKRYGNVIYFAVAVRNTSSVAVGDMVFQATVTGIPLPPGWVTTGTYYGARPWIGAFASNGTVYLRNTYSAAITMGANDTAAFSFTYVV